MRRPHGNSVLWVFAALAAAQCSLAAQFCPDKLGPEFEVLPNLPGHQGLSDRGNALVVDLNGDAVLGFNSNHLSNAADPFIQRFDTGGALIGPTILVNPTLNSFDGAPTLAVAPDGTLIAAWTSSGLDGDEDGIFACFFDDLGDPLGPEFQVNESFHGGQINPRVGIDHAGNAAILWGDHGLPNGETRLVLRIFAPGGVPLTGEVEVALNTGASSLAMTHDGLVLVVWGTRTAGWDIMGRYYGSDGVSLTAAPFVIDDAPGFNHHAWWRALLGHLLYRRKPILRGTGNRRR